MKLPKSFKSMKAGLLLLLVAFPWYFRDQKAASLDRQNDLVQKALVQAENQEQAEAQNRDQREVLTRLKNLEAASAKSDVENAWRDFADEVGRDGKDLDRQATELQGLVKDLRSAEMESALKEDLEEADDAVDTAKNAAQLQTQWAADMTAFIDEDPAEAAKVLASYDVTPADQQQDQNAQPNSQSSPPEGLPASADLDAADKAAASADTDLTSAYSNLKDSAEDVRDKTASKAKDARMYAWIATALAALLAGDWKKLLQTVTGDSGDSEAADQPA